MRRLSLRWRVAWLYALIGLALSVGFAAATAFIAEDYEHIVVQAVLQSQGRNYLEQLGQNPQAPLPRTPGFSVYREADAPEEFRGLEDGIYEPDHLDIDGVHVGVFGQAPERLVFIIDLGAIEARELYLAQIMLTIVLLGSLLAGWLGWVVAGRAVGPVRELAQSVETLPVRPTRTQLASGYGRDEVGRLATAIDQYQARLCEAESAEQGFHANASHELRTPITIVQGVIEVMREDPIVVERQGRRLDRADRAIDELSLLLEALLLGGRALPEERISVVLADVVKASLKRVAQLWPAASERLQLEIVVDGRISAPPRWLDAILNVLFQRVLSRAVGVNWLVQVAQQRLSLSESGPPREDQRVVDRSDIGLGLMFIERLCRELGWCLQQAQDRRGRLRVDLAFSDGPVSGAAIDRL